MFSGLLSPSYPLFQWYLQSKDIWLNLSMECSSFWCCVFLVLWITLMTVTWCLKFTLDSWLYISKNQFFIFESHRYGSNNQFFDFLRATNMDPRTGGFYVIWFLLNFFKKRAMMVYIKKSCCFVLFFFFSHRCSQGSKYYHDNRRGSTLVSENCPVLRYVCPKVPNVLVISGTSKNWRFSWKNSSLW